MTRTGGAVVLVHGWCGHAGFWRHQVSELAPGRQVVAVDFTRDAAAQSIADFADVVAATATRLDQPALALVGHSMGGPVALEAAIRLGARCRFVLGVDTFTDAAFYQRRPAAEIDLRIRLFDDDFAATMRRMVARILPADADPEVVRWTEDELAAAPVPAALTALRSLLDWDIGSIWPSVPCPVETINSAWLDNASRRVEGLAGLVVHPMDGVGHFPMLEAPERFNALARAILERHLGPAAA